MNYNKGMNYITKFLNLKVLIKYADFENLDFANFDNTRVFKIIHQLGIYTI